MKKKVTNLVEDIDNIAYVLCEFCKNIEQTENINSVRSIAKCIQDKAEQLYIILHKH